ncbi:MAG: aminotransferase class V-fold PLP-dependent enzyme [Oscillospiraceae bacterium]|nr:aminotransferase class V-fold PLP-dependent enzyme [Oscillospiraceae bacterium]
MEKKDVKLFTVGPAQMYQHTLEVRSHVVPYFRTPEFGKMNLESAELMRNIMDADDDSEVLFLTCSGSGAMEATVMNCFNKDDKILIISGGTFGERFEQICKIHNIPYTPIKLGPDETLTQAHLASYANKGYTGLLVNLHETYTGQLYDINMISGFCAENNLYLVVDAISTFLCDEYHMSKYGIDATIVSSQKGLCLAPGLSAVVLSRRMVNNKVLTNSVQSMYFDFKDYIKNMSRGQTPFTPSVGVLFELNDMLRYIDNQGVAARVKEVSDRCKYFRGKLENMPVHLPSFPLSNAITPVRFEKPIAEEFFTYLKDEKNIMVNPVGGELGKTSIRVAHIGDLTFEDYDFLLGEMASFFSF